MNNTKVVGVISLIAGILLIIGGAITYFAVSQQLGDEKIVVPADAAFLAGDDVNGPFSAYAQADIISTHALAISEGKTYAELGELAGQAEADGDTELATQYNGQRDTVMNASFLRASLFTSVLAFGVAALVVGLGIMLGLIGWALMSIRPAVVHTNATPENAAI